MKKILIILVIITAGFKALSWARLPKTPEGWASRVVEVDGPRAPYKVDDIVSVTRVEKAGPRLVAYSIKIDRSSADLAASGFLSSMPKAKQLLLEDSAMKRLLKNGVTVRCSLFGREGGFLQSITLYPQDVAKK